MKARLRGMVLVAFAVMAHAACGGVSATSVSGTTSPSSLGGSGDAGDGRVPVNHRPSDAQCSAPAAAGTCVIPVGSSGGCASDSDCTVGTNGRCLGPPGGPAAPCSCTYDACASDSACGSGKTCACHGAPYTDGAGNTCVAGNCQVDSDCGNEGYCSPSPLTADCGDSLAGYYCHTANDGCVDDTDCSPGDSVGAAAACAYSATDARWVCIARPICG